MSKADDRAFLRKRHAVCLDRIVELKAKPTRTAEEKERLTDAIEAAQFLERELEALGKV
jgi:hypothetical protein